MVSKKNNRFKKKYVPCDHYLSSFGKPCDANWSSFLSNPHTHDGFFSSFAGAGPD